MNTADFISKCDEIEKDIWSLEHEDPKIFPIPDGIINVSKYLEAKFKILWILKESNDINPADGQGGGWCLNRSIDEGTGWSEKNRTGKTTFKRMISVSYSILNGFPLFKDIPLIENNNFVWETIKKIAYINVKKFPGYSTAYNPTIRNAYLKNKGLLIKQIDTYNPDIIIGGSTLKLFLKDLGIDNSPKTFGSVNYYTLNGKLYIDAYHPGVRPNTISGENYCNDLIMTTKEWYHKTKA